jgi:hypothetical protein
VEGLALAAEAVELALLVEGFAVGSVARIAF